MIYDAIWLLNDSSWETLRPATGIASFENYVEKIVLIQFQIPYFIKHIPKFLKFKYNEVIHTG